ncbi:MAG: BON domain-containing protein [Planctomycetota bacterium]
MIDSGVRDTAGEKDIAGRARNLLSESPIAEVRHVRVEQKGDKILLQGRVRTFYAKQMAQETVRPALGDLLLVNSVNVE